MKFQDSYKGRPENECWIATPEKKKPQKKEYEVDSKTKVLNELWTLVSKKKYKLPFEN